MRKELKFHVKIGLILFAFSSLVTSIFIVSMSWFTTNNMKSQIREGGLYILSSKDYNNILESDGRLQIDRTKIVGTEQYTTHLLSTQFHKLYPISLLFLLCLFVFSFCLWLILGYIQKKQTIKMVEQVNVATMNVIESSEPALAEAYKELKLKFDSQLHDYQKLNAYLSHEQKNTIAILRTSLELSEDTINLKTIDHMIDGIDDILTLSENADESPMTIVDVALICAEVCDSYMTISDKISFQFDGNDDTEIIAKSRWIYRAVANLLDNALKYGMDKPIELSICAKHNCVIVSVKDQGIGIEETMQELIFNEHYRIHELNKNGYGIGLSLVSHVCDLCGGFVTVESSLHSGSTFYLSFPQKIS